MSYNPAQPNQALNAPPQVMPYIPPGMFIDIDEKFYSPPAEELVSLEGFPRQGQPIEPYTINYGNKNFVENQAPLGGFNYGSYLFNPKPAPTFGRGTDRFH